MNERRGGNTPYLVFQSYAVLMTIANVVFQLTAQLSLPGVNYEKDPMVASAYALMLSCYLSPVVILAALFDIYSRPSRLSGTGISSKKGKSATALAVALVNVFLLLAVLSALAMFFFAAVVECKKSHPLTTCTEDSTNLRWQAIYAIVHSAAMAVFIGFITVFQFFRGGELAVVSSNESIEPMGQDIRDKLLNNPPFSGFYHTRR